LHCNENLNNQCPTCKSIQQFLKHQNEVIENQCDHLLQRDMEKEDYNQNTSNFKQTEKPQEIARQDKM